MNQRIARDARKRLRVNLKKLVLRLGVTLILTFQCTTQVLKTIPRVYIKQLLTVALQMITAEIQTGTKTDPGAI